MHNEGVTSLPVLDNHKNVIGNISHVDVRLLTSTASLPLLDSTCTHFVTVILSERGMNDGKDSYPVFHVTPFNTLAHTVAKLVATRSHRMWIVDAPSPQSSVPPSPAIQPVNPAAMVQPSTFSTGTTASTGTGPGLGIGAPALPPAAATPGPPYTPATPAVNVSAAGAPGATLSGRLSGVVSLTDVLNLYARATGLRPEDPEETRRRRRRSSSSSVRRSMDGLGGNGNGNGNGNGGGSMRGSVELARSPSGRR